MASPTHGLRSLPPLAYSQPLAPPVKRGPAPRAGTARCVHVRELALQGLLQPLTNQPCKVVGHVEGPFPQPWAGWRSYPPPPPYSLVVIHHRCTSAPQDSYSACLKGMPHELTPMATEVLEDMLAQKVGMKQRAARLRTQESNLLERIAASNLKTEGLKEELVKLEEQVRAQAWWEGSRSAKDGFLGVGTCTHYGSAAGSNKTHTALPMRQRIFFSPQPAQFADALAA